METSNITTSHQTGIFSSAEEFNGNNADPLARLDALLKLNAEIAREKSLYRFENEEFEASLMRCPFSPETAYGIFGLLLGTFPPAAIFSKLFGHDIGVENGVFMLACCLAMNVICAGVGFGMGKTFGRVAVELERGSWSKMLVLTPLIGAMWAIVTGFAGAMLFFVIGGIFGVMFALPVALTAFPLFAVLHRLMQRAGKIDRRHLLPIAFGLTLTIAAFILGMGH